MEIKLYTAKEAKEIIKKYPDKMLRTKCVVVDLVVDSDGIEHEKRMFYMWLLAKLRRTSSASRIRKTKAC
jgi:hypothetical protein